MNVTHKMLLLGCLALSAAVQAAPDGRHPGRMHDRGGLVATEAIEHFTKALRRLDLDEEQKSAIRAEMHVMRGSLKPLIQELHAGRKALGQQLLSGSFDEQAVQQIALSQGSLTTEITMLVSQTVNSAIALLNDEQKAELRAMADSREAHRAEVKERVRAHREHRKEFRDREEDSDG